MTEEEKLAEEYYNSILYRYADTEEDYSSDIKQAFLAGLKAGKDMAEADLATIAYMQGAERYKPRWHYLKYADLPKEDNKIVLCIEINGYIENKPNYVYKLLTKNEFPFSHSLVAWCELPKFEKEER